MNSDESAKNQDLPTIPPWSSFPDRAHPFLSDPPVWLLAKHRIVALKLETLLLEHGQKQAGKPRRRNPDIPDMLPGWLKSFLGVMSRVVT